MLSTKQIIIVDVESTCWENQNAPSGQQSEIIEIGVCRLELESGDIHDKRSILVKPARSKVSMFCTQLTTLTQEMVNEGVSFAEACQMLQDDYASAEWIWGSWGAYDQRMFANQCRSFGVAYPFGDCHLNIKNLFSAWHSKKRVGMAAALRISGLPLQGTHHRGHDDAYNIARLLGFLVSRYGEEVIQTGCSEVD